MPLDVTDKEEVLPATGDQEYVTPLVVVVLVMTTVALEQVIVGLLVMVKVGRLLTVTVLVAVFTHPADEVPVTV